MIANAVHVRVDIGVGSTDRFNENSLSFDLERSFIHSLAYIRNPLVESPRFSFVVLLLIVMMANSD